MPATIDIAARVLEMDNPLADPRHLAEANEQIAELEAAIGRELRAKAREAPRLAIYDLFHALTAKKRTALVEISEQFA